MNVHENARSTPKGRAEMGRRFKIVGLLVCKTGLHASLRLHQPTDHKLVERIIALQWQRLTGEPIAMTVGLSAETAIRVLRRTERACPDWIASRTIGFKQRSKNGRMRGLSNFKSKGRGIATTDPHVQLASTPWQLKRKTTNQRPWNKPKHSIEVPQIIA